MLRRMQGPLRLFLLLSLVALANTSCGKKKGENGEANGGTARSSSEAAAASARARIAAENAAASDRSGKGQPHVAIPADSPAGSAPAGVSAELAKSDEVYEAWFRKHHLDLNDPNMLDADPDHDGVSNRDEFMADTDPNDPKSHPALAAASGEAHAGLRLKQYNEVRLPIVLESVDGDTAKIKRLDAGDKSETVRTGQTIAGLGLRVEKVQARRMTDKHGTPVDASRMTLQDPNTQESTVLVKDMPARSASTYAILTSEDGKSSVTVKQGDSFTWPQNGGATYKVVDLRADQAVLQDEKSGKMWTVMK